MTLASAVAVIGDANSAITGNVGAVNVDVYTNASSPTLLKAAANFFSDSLGPVYSAIFDESGAQWTGSYPVWIGATASNNGVDSCRTGSSSWTNATSSADGEYLDIGGMSQSWFTPPDPNNYTPLKKPCNQTAKILCLLK